MAHITDWQSLANSTPEWEALVESIGGQVPNLDMFGDVTTLRDFEKVIEKRKKAEFATIPAGIKEEKDQEIAMRDGGKIKIRIYTPDKAGGPLYVRYHGGGWCFGGLESDLPWNRELCGKHGFVIVDVDYRLAPEYKFPVAYNDTWDSLKWVAENASQLGADTSKGFIIGGSSAGAGLCAAISHIARDEKLSPPLTGVHLVIPATCDASATPEKYKHLEQSWEQNKNAPVLNRGACDMFFNAFISPSQRADPLFSPLLWETGHADLPPAYFQICGADPLRDQGLIYEKVLREEAAVKTAVDVYPGLPHGFASIFPQMESSKKFMEEGVRGVQWLLEQRR